MFLNLFSWCPGSVGVDLRFMASSLFLLKISLYQKHIATDQQNIINANILAEYVAHIRTQ